ncbi:MAG: hypothetical protein ACREEE_01010 [Dongiaceae bacterium]
MIAVGLCFAAHGVLAEDQDSFIAGVEDLPLMPGLREIPAAGTVFDSAGGRIVEAYAVGDVDEDAVMAFYKDSLPQLGWTIVDQTMFRRSGEILKLEFARAATELTVHFSLSPE